MKTHSLLSGLLALTLSLAACAPATTITNPTTSSEGVVANGTPGPNTFTPFGGGADQPLPLATQLVIGTFALEKTDFAVSAEQAASLLPLWQAVKALSASSTAASVEISATVEQIQETMTPEQMTAITDLKLTRSSMFSVTQELGLSFGNFNGQNGQGQIQRTPQAGGGFQGGGFAGGGGGFGGPPGDFGGGGGFPGAQSTLTPDQQATRQALRGSRPGLGVPTVLVDELIKLLETRAQGQ